MITAGSLPAIPSCSATVLTRRASAARLRVDAGQPLADGRPTAALLKVPNGMACSDRGTFVGGSPGCEQSGGPATSSASAAGCGPHRPDARAASPGDPQAKRRLEASSSSVDRAHVGQYQRASSGVPHGAWRSASLESPGPSPRRPSGAARPPAPPLPRTAGRPGGPAVASTAPRTGCAPVPGCAAERSGCSARSPAAAPAAR